MLSESGISWIQLNGNTKWAVNHSSLRVTGLYTTWGEVLNFFQAGELFHCRERVENVAFFLWSPFTGIKKKNTFNLIRRNVLFWFWNVLHLVAHSNLEKLLQSQNIRIYLKVCRIGFNMFLKIRVCIKVSLSLGRSEL